MVVHMASPKEIVGLLGTLNATLFNKISFVIEIRESIKVKKNKQGLLRKKERTPTSRCGCETKYQVHIDFRSGCWYIKCFDDVNNLSVLYDKYK
jgi:hypothetical protein